MRKARTRPLAQQQLLGLLGPVGLMDCIRVPGEECLGDSLESKHTIDQSDRAHSKRFDGLVYDKGRLGMPGLELR